jgi:hypothetical protein
VTIVTGEKETFPTTNNVGATQTSTASCTTGQLVGGGANISDNGTGSTQVVALTASYPSDPTTWTAVATVLFFRANGATPSVTAYAICAS